MPSPPKRWIVGSFAAITLLFLFNSAGHAIVWGEPDGDRHPSAGALFLQFDPDVFSLPDPGVPPGVLPICSGSVVAQSDTRALYLTAGHCVLGLLQAMQALGPLNPAPVVSFSGNHHVDPGVAIPVDMTALHFQLGIPGPPTAIGALPDFDDIGLLVLQAGEAAHLPVPLALPPPGLLDALGAAGLRRSEFRVIGFGDDITPPAPHTRARVFGIRQIGFPRPVNLGDKYLMGQQNGPSGSSGIYFGDSGGPAFWVDPGTGEEWLVAINAHPVGAVNVSPDVATLGQYYRIDTPHALAFIQMVGQAEGF